MKYQLSQLESHSSEFAYSFSPFMPVVLNLGVAINISWARPKSLMIYQHILCCGLHIEKASIHMIGDWLEDSDWVEALLEAKVASSWPADSFLKATHITRTRHARQVTACSLYILLKEAYSQYTKDPDTSDLVETIE